MQKETANYLQRKLNLIIKLLLVISIFFYFASLCLPAVDGLQLMSGIDVGRQRHIGLGMLIEGWEGVLYGNPAWLANITYIFSFLLLCGNLNLAALIFSVITLLLGLSSEIIVIEDHSVTFLFGYYLWVSSFLLLLVASFFKTKK
jgi:hypothetical protein